MSPLPKKDGDICHHLLHFFTTSLNGGSSTDSSGSSHDNPNAFSASIRVCSIDLFSSRKITLNPEFNNAS